MSEKKSRGAGRTRNFATEIYLDSAPENWFDILVDTKIPCFISPYHDKDYNVKRDENGELVPKKAHFHIMLMFDSVKTEEQAREVCSLFNGVGLEIVNSIRGYARYLCHLDNPEKAQYPIDEVRCLGGADYLNVVALPKDKYTAIREIIEYIRNNQIDSYAELLDYCAVQKTDWFVCLCDNGTYVIKEYIKSYRWEEDKRRLQERYNDYEE